MFLVASHWSPAFRRTLTPETMMSWLVETWPVVEAVLRRDVTSEAEVRPSAMRVCNAQSSLHSFAALYQEPLSAY